MSRQPLFPDSTKEAVDLAEMMEGGGHSKQRRENFAKTAQSKFFLQSSICTFILYYKQIRSNFNVLCTANKYAVTLMCYFKQI